MAAKSSKKSIADKDDLSFEEILSELEVIVKELEKGDIPLEKSLSTFEKGIRLSRLGTIRLDEAERRIEVLLNDNDDNEVQTRPLVKEPEGQ